MSTLRLEIPAKMLPFATQAKRHKIARGGRGSGKSWSIARILIAKLTAERTRWLCCREVQKSIRESSHRLIADQIEAMGLGHLWDVQRDRIVCQNGSEFAFAGLQDHTADALKSYEGFDGSWVEEAHKITEDSANKLIPTIRKPGSEIWWSYNPDDDDDYIHRKAEAGGDDCLVVTINYPDNPWFPDVLEGERLAMLAINQDLHDHIWGGKTRNKAGVIFKRHWFKRYPLGQQPARLNLYLSSDLAGGPDPDEPEKEPDWCEHGVWGVDERGEYWAVDWWSGQEDPDKAIAAWLALIRRHKPLMAFDEKGTLLRAMDAAMRAAMRDERTFVARESLVSAGSKADRALGFAARAATGIVHIPECPWGDRLVNQLCAFTGAEGKTDDMVDVCSLLARGLDHMANARPAAIPHRHKPPTPFTEDWLRQREIAEERAREQDQHYYR